MCSYSFLYWGSFTKKIFLTSAFVITWLLLSSCFANAASLSFSPASGTYQKGNPLSVGVFTGSPSLAINAISGVVSFDKNLLEVTSISKNQSIVSLWVQEPSFSNSAGTVTFEGIVLNPGFAGSNGKIITINFRVKAQGSAPLSFASGAVLANDGSGTDVLSALGTAQFVLVSKTPSEEENATPSPATEETNNSTSALLPHIQSLTHREDTESWSSQTSDTFTFTIPNDVIALRLLLDDNQDSIPTVVYAPPITTREITDLKEGVSYLHVQYKNNDGWGPILHSALKTDTHAPDTFVIREVGQGVFKFDAKDSLSGIAYFEVQIDEGKVIHFVDLGDHIYSAPLLPAGSHTLSAKAFDKAGNYTPANLDFVILATPIVETVPPVLTTRENFVEKGQMVVTILSVVIPSMALVLLLLTLLYFVWHKLGGLRRRIDTEVLEAKMIVHRAFALLRDDLAEDIQTLEKASKKRKLTPAESKILKRLRTNIDQAEQVIIKEVTDIESEITSG